MVARLRLVVQENITVFIISILTTLFFFRPHILGKAYFWEDFTEQAYPNRVFASKMMEKGEFPHWNPYSFCGMPFQADVQTALAYPPHIIFDHLIGAHSERGVYWLQILLILHFVVAQISMYVLARQLSISSGAAIIASVAYAFSAPLALHTHHAMFIEHLAWLPLFVLFIYRTSYLDSVSAIGWGGLIGGMMLLSGAPQLNLYTLSFCSMLVLWWSLIQKKRRWYLQLLAVVRGVALIVLAIGIYSIQYFPSSELARLSERSTLSYEQATEGSLEWEQLTTAIVPKVFGIVLPPDQPNAAQYYREKSYLYWDTAFYFSIAILVLSLWVIVRCWRSNHVIVVPFALLSFIAIVFALGSNAFLYPIIYKLPLFGQLRIPARMLFVVSFSSCILAALGWDELTRLRDRTSLRVFFATTALVIVPTVAIITLLSNGIISPPSERIRQSVLSNSWLQIFFIIASAVAIFLRLKATRTNTNWLSLCIAAIAFYDLYSAHAAFSRSRINPAQEYSRAFPSEHREYFVPKPPDTVFRVSMRKPGIIAMKRNQGLVDGIMLFEGYNQLLLKRRHPAVSSPELVADMLAIQWTVERDDVYGWRFVKRKISYPMAWIVHKVLTIDPDSVEFLMRTNNAIDYRKVAIIERELPFQLGKENPGDTVRCLRYTSNLIQYQVRTEEPCLLVLSEIYYPAWKAYVDRIPTTIFRANYCLRAIPVPAGKHTIELRYESESYATGSLITAASLSCAIVVIMISGIRRIQTLLRHPTRT